jgi:hypothetical protein
MIQKFNYTKVVSINAGQSIRFLGDVQSPCTFFPLSINSSASGIKIELFETPTVSNNGTSVQSVSLNRMYTIPAKTLVYSNPTVSNNGTKIYESIVIGDKHSTPVNGFNTSFNLIETQYLYVITNTGSQTANLSIDFNWEEIYRVELYY